MRKTTKLLSLLLVMMMVVSSAAVAFAEDIPAEPAESAPQEDYAIQDNSEASADAEEQIPADEPQVPELQADQLTQEEAADQAEEQVYPVIVVDDEWSIKPAYWNEPYTFKETIKDNEVFYCDLFFVDTYSYHNSPNYDPVSEFDVDDHYSIRVFNDKMTLLKSINTRNGRHVTLSYNRDELGSDGIYIMIKNNDDLGATALVDCKKLRGYCDSVSVDPEEMNLRLGQKVSLTYNCEQAGDDSICVVKEGWSSSNSRVASVDQNGVVTATGKGSCYVTLKMKGGASASCLVNVTYPDPSLNYASLNLGKGQSKTLKLNYATSKVTWKSSNKKVATVSKAGKVKAKKNGKCTITAKSGGKTYKCTVRVTKPKVYFYAAVDEYNTRGNYFVLKVRNNSYKTLYITSGTKVKHFDYKDCDRKIHLKKKVAIKPNRTKYVKFYVKGGVTDSDRCMFLLNYKFKFNGKTYKAQAHWCRSDYKAGKWKSTYPSAEENIYENWR